VLEVRDAAIRMPVLTRRIDLRGGVGPAIRVAVLLVHRAVRALEAGGPPDDSPAPAASVATATLAQQPAKTTELGFGVDVFVSGLTWWRPSSTQTGIGGAVRFVYDRLTLEAGASFSPSQHRSNEDVDATASDVLAMAGGWWTLVVAGPFSLSLGVDLGLDAYTLTVARATSAGPNTPESHSNVRAFVLPAVRAELLLTDRLSVVGKMGGLATPAPFHLTLPGGFGHFNPSLDTGILNAYLAIGVGYRALNQ
jgi:hypothetical protein